MSVNTISLDKVVDPGIKKHFVDGYKQLKPTMIEKLFKTDKQTSETDEYQRYTGISSFSSVVQGGTFQEDAPIKSYGVNLTAVKFGRLIKVTYETMKWAKVKEIWDASNMLGKAAARHINKSGASVLNNGFNTAFTSYSDGKPLFSTQHPRADGGAAQSNASATSIPLNDDNLEVALLALEYQLDDRGEAIELMGTRLIVPPHLRKKAIAVTKSERKTTANSDGSDDSAPNDVNVYRSAQEFYGIIDVLVWYYLAASTGGLNTQWFVEDPSTSMLMWNWADKPQVDKDTSVGFKQQTTYYRGHYMASKGWGDWRGFWGSKGNNASYSD